MLLYTLVYGAMPFDGSNMRLLVRQIREGNIFEPRPPSCKFQKHGKHFPSMFVSPAASTLIRWMLTVKADDRATIVDICNHWWINEGYENGCLEEAEYLASLAPVRFDLLLSLNKQEKKSCKDGDPETEGEERDGKETPSVDIQEMPADTPIPDGIEECDVSVSEEPDDSPRRRRKKEKRKLDNSSTGGDAHVPKKYERNEEVIQPPPPAYEKAPEPMEAEQVYERPRERRKEDGRTPRVRRKHKSKEDLLTESEAPAMEEVQRKPPHKPKSPRPEHCDQNGDVKKKSVRKEKRTKENGSEGFERPVPCASPRPPRTPPPPEWNDAESSPPPLDDSIPPPLPEKKRKSPGKQPEPIPPAGEPELAQDVLPHEPCPQPPSPVKTKPESPIPAPQPAPAPAPVNSEPPPPLPSEADRIRKQEEEKSRTLDRLVEAVQNGFASVQSMVQSLPSAAAPVSEPPRPPQELPSNANFVAPVCDLPAKDNISVIPPAEPLLEAVPTPEGPTKEKSLIQAPHGPHPAESASGKPSRPAEPEKSSQPPHSSVGEVGACPGLHPGQQSQDENAPHSGRNSSESQPSPAPSLQAPAPPTNIVPEPPKAQQQKENVPPPLVKPFPSQPTNSRPPEFPPKDVSSPEPTSIKPPWVKDPQKNLSENSEAPGSQLPTVLPSSPQQNEAPAILTNQKDTSQKIKESRGINNLPRLKIDNQVPGDFENNEVATPTTPLPLVVPFPGRTGPAQLVKQDSPKSLINNIPKPFKAEPEKQSDSAINVESNSSLPIAPTESAEVPMPSPPSSGPAPPSDHQNSLEPIPAQPSPADPVPSLVRPPVPTPETCSVPTPTLPTPPASTPSMPTPPVSAPAPVLPIQKTPGLARSSPRPAQPIQYSNGTPRKSPLPQMKVESSPPAIRQGGPKFPTASRKGSTDSVGSAISLSSDGDHRSTPPSPMILPRPNGPNINMAALSPSNSGSNIGPQEKSRDSKVIKAAAYWNNYIGEVKSKARPPANPKTMEKPKKIVSAGIGENAMKDMTKAFESGKPITEGDKFTLLRRNSKKMSVESINPGLRVNDAKSHFEKKAALQQPIETPRMTRRASGSLETPRTPHRSRDESGESKSLLEPAPITIESLSKSPSPSKSESVLVAPKPKSKSKSPAPSSNQIAPTKKEAEIKLKQEVQRNTVAAPPPVMISEPELNQKPPPEIPTVKEQQPKPPTSPKPKVRKEELKLKEDLAKKDDKPRLITKLKGDEINMVAPLRTTETKETSDKATVKSLKEEQPEKQPERFESKLEINHNPPKEQLPEKDKENNEVTPSTPTTPLVKPILREKNRKSAEEGKGKETFIECRNVTKDMDNGQPAKLVTKTVKIKSPEPEKPAGSSPPEQRIELSDVRSSLKRVPHVAVARRRSFTEKDEPSLEFTQQPPSEKKVVRSEIVIPVKATEDDLGPVEPAVAEQPVATLLPETVEAIEVKEVAKEVEASPKERIIPIQLVNENRSLGPKPFKLESNSRPQTPTGVIGSESASSPQQTSTKLEHHIPIVVEGKGSTTRVADEEQEKLDNFNTSSIQRHRWGSRKKRMSSAFSDSSMSDDEALNTPFGGGGQNQGLQKGFSYGKHGPGEGHNYTLKKTRPPFAESFSSGEDDDLDDDGLQQISAETLFSTLLSRVKSLTRRIHDEHDEHLSWQQKQRHGPPKLNPGGTHARLERTAQRNSIKRDREPVPDSTPAYSRQSSAYGRGEEPYSNTSSLRSSYGNSSAGYEPRKIYNRSNSGQTDPDSRFSTSSRYSTADRAAKRYEEAGDSGSEFSNSVSVTSSQRLRPGYLPPPANPTHSTALPANSTANTVDPISVAQSVINRAQEKSERSIPINIQRQNSQDSPVSSKPGTPLPTNPGVYNTHMKPFSPTPTNESSRDQSRLESPEPLSEGTDKNRRVSRFLRPDFYETAKEDSIYAKMRELEDDQKKLPRYLRGSNITRTTKSGRSTPLDYASYNAEERSRGDTVNPRPDSQEHVGPPGTEGQFPNRALTLTRRNSMKEPTSRLSLANNSQDVLRPPQSIADASPNIAPVSANLPAENAQLYRRTIKPYLGAKSEGHLLNKHANVSLNIIAAAERKKRQSYVGTEGEAGQEAKVTSPPSLLS